MTGNPSQQIKPGMLTLANPFPGLRPFSAEESHLFFGREGQCEVVLEYLATRRFAAVTGASGSGKSSLIYCGLIPALYGGFISQAGSKWRVITTRPGNSPVENLAEGIIQSEKPDKSQVENQINKQIIYTVLRRSSYGLVNAVRQIRLEPGENILLILDQFEELFRFKESRKDFTAVNETEAYIKLLVNAIRQTDQPIYVVMTMRSDFIGECSQFQEMTKLINNSNYLIPQMTRDNFREAILGPLAVGGAKVDPQLLQQLLNAIEDKNDQLPVLQHVMMRTWEFWIRNNEAGVPLRMRDYEAAGKIENALSMHANEAYEELSEEGKEVCAVLFKCLTEKGADNKGTRHPATIRHIADIAQVADEKVIEVVNKFRAKGRSFVTPVEGNIDSDTVIDISHESLMRIWNKLRSWVDEEYSSVQMYQRLAEAASLYQIGKTGLWRPPDLQLALNWKKTQKPTLAWAKKYNPAFEKVMVFLDASEKKYTQEEQAKVRLQRMELNRTRRFGVITLMAAVAFLFISVWGFQQRSVALERAREADLNRTEAEYQRGEAERLREEAENKYDRADVERIIAQNVADSAQQRQLMAQLQSQQAELQRVAAQQRAEQEALRSERLQQQTIVAQQSASQAREEADQAEVERSLVTQKRMINISQTLASQAPQEPDADLRGNMAYLAYKFNRNFKGQTDRPDIYNALYSALTGFKDKDFNALRGSTQAVNKVTFLPGSNICYTTGTDGRILIWDLDAPTAPPRTLKNNNFMNRTLAISPDGRWLANSTTSNTIQLFNLTQEGSDFQQLEGHNGWIGALSFTPDGRTLYSASSDNTIVAWDLINGGHSIFMTLTNTVPMSLEMSPSGGFLFCGTNDGRLIRYDTGTKAQTTLYSGTASINSISINSTGSKIAFGDQNGILRIADAGTQSILQQVSAHSANIKDVDYSPDNQQIATASYDKTIKIWDANNLQAVQPVVIRSHNAFGQSVAFSPDGRYLVSSSSYETTPRNEPLFYWWTHNEGMASQICGLVSRDMTQSEWRTNVGNDIPYESTCP